MTLVFQQYAVLECNLDQKIDRFCGEMGCEFWSKDVWKKHFATNMAIVCTADILHQCLMHAFIKIEDINLLIFDEAHHTKKNHAYARYEEATHLSGVLDRYILLTDCTITRIIKDFYLAQDDLRKRPRIFGMTASPIDAKVNVVKAAR